MRHECIRRLARNVVLGIDGLLRNMRIFLGEAGDRLGREPIRAQTPDQHGRGLHHAELRPHLAQREFQRLFGDADKPLKFPLREMWAELGMVKTPTMLIRGLRSDRFPPETVARFTKEYPHIPQLTADSQHDIPGQAPDAFVAPVKTYIGSA